MTIVLVDGPDMKPFTEGLLHQVQANIQKHLGFTRPFGYTSITEASTYGIYLDIERKNCWYYQGGRPNPVTCAIVDYHDLEAASLLIELAKH